MNGVLLRSAAIAGAVLGLLFAPNTSLVDAQSHSNAPPYEVYRPAGLSRNNPVPLVIGIGGSLTKTSSGFNSFADRYGFVVAYPDPFSITVPGSREDDGQTATARINYLNNLIHDVASTENIDTSRVYVTGASKSAVESYRVACRLSANVTAIGSVAGALLPRDAAACKPSRPVSVVEIHGTADTAVPYNGNQVYPGVRTTVDFWRKANGCPTQAKVLTQGRVIVETWSPCKAGTAVRLITYTGGGHGWPRNKDLDTTAQLWDFFSQHSSSKAKPLVATVNRLTVGGAGAHRTLTFRLAVNQSAAARATLLRGARSFGSKRFSVAAGTRSLHLSIASRARAGVYMLKVVLTTSDGTRKALQKTLRLRA